ncbi:LysR family transcriptional regulator [Spongisporangium articulatum]|uniref:LysR family transcriptional regulator n=1 Tax=Spongisporangium articulatum TaxID=3362603 RepID=A0ABW8AK31_9ACTN
MTAELRHLRAFLAIAEEGSVTGAAVRLNLTQPALSRTLAQLEAHLGVRLVDRSTHHLRLTEAGAEYRERAAAALRAVDDVLDPRQVSGTPVRLGHAWAALGRHTPAVQRRWAQEHPQTTLELLSSDDVSGGLGQGRVDVAVLRSRVRLSGVRVERLLSEPRLGVVPSGTPLAERDSLVLADLAGHPVAVNTTVGTTSLALWGEGPAPSRVLEVSNTDDWLAAIAGGRAFGVTPAATAEVRPHPGVTYLALDDAPPVDVYLAWREPYTHPAVPELLALIRSVTQ